MVARFLDQQSLSAEGSNKCILEKSYIIRLRKELIDLRLGHEQACDRAAKELARRRISRCRRRVENPVAAHFVGF